MSKKLLSKRFTDVAAREQRGTVTTRDTTPDPIVVNIEKYIWNIILE